MIPQPCQRATKQAQGFTLTHPYKQAGFVMPYIFMWMLITVPGNNHISPCRSRKKLGAENCTCGRLKNSNRTSLYGIVKRIHEIQLNRIRLVWMMEISLFILMPRHRVKWNWCLLLGLGFDVRPRFSRPDKYLLGKSGASTLSNCKN